METLDLHGVRHANVDRIVENFVIINDLPIKIITGNSPQMRSIVFAVLSRHSFRWDYENHWNLGSIIVTN